MANLSAKAPSSEKDFSMKPTPKPNHIGPILGHALLITLAIMGFALANRYVALSEGLPCSIAIPLHATYFFILQSTLSIYGSAYKQKFIGLTTIILLALVGWTTIIQHMLPTVPSSMTTTALWEVRFPTETVLFWVFGLFLHLLPSKYRVSSSGNPMVVAWHTLGIGTGSYIILALIRQYEPTCLPISMEGNILGWILTTLLCTSIYYLAKPWIPVLPNAQTWHPQKLPWGYLVLLSFFCGACISTNLLVGKHVYLLQEAVTLSLFSYVWTFFFTDAISELYDDQHTKWAVWAGLAANLTILLTTTLAEALPLHPNSPTTNCDFQASFDFVTATLFASFIAYLVAQFLDIYLFNSLRKKTQARHLWLRNNLATILSQTADTFLFAGIAWLIWLVIGSPQEQTLPWSTWWQITYHEYRWKILFALLDTPLLYLMLHFFKKRTQPQLEKPTKKK